MNNDKSIAVLNMLIQINNDRISGYEHASNETDELDLKRLFTELAATSRKCNDELIDEVEELDGSPAEGTTAAGKIFRIWMDVRAALTNKDRQGILDSCEYGEDWAVKTYEDALRNHLADISFEHAQMVRDQFEWIKKDRYKVRQLRDTVLV